MSPTPQTSSQRFAPLPEGVSREPDVAEKAVLQEWRERDVFARLQAEREDAPPFVMVTHHVDEIPPGATHAALLRDGRLRYVLEMNAAQWQEALGVPVDARDGVTGHTA